MYEKMIKFPKQFRLLFLQYKLILINLKNQIHLSSIQSWITHHYKKNLRGEIIMSTVHSVYNSLCLRFILSTIHFVYDSFCLRFILSTIDSVYGSFCLQFFMSAIHYINNSFCLQVIVWKSSVNSFYNSCCSWNLIKRLSMECFI